MIDVGRFETRDCVDDTVLGAFEVFGPAEVRAAVETARAAAAGAADSSLTRRIKLLRAWRGRLWRGASELATLLHRESGLSLDDALFEVMQTVEHLRWVESNAVRVLGSVTRGGGLLAPELARRTSYLPEGVVGVISSPYAPLYGPASAVASALMSGNAVLLAPPQQLSATFVAYADALPAEVSLLQVLTGGDATTAALTAAGPDRICLFGNAVATARVASRCAAAMVPLTTVPVGPPVTVVAPDADVVIAAAAVARTVARSDGRDGLLPEVYVAPIVSEEFDAALAATLDSPGSGARSLGRGGLVRALNPAVDVSERVRIRADAEFGDVLERLSGRPYAQVAVFSRERGQRIGEALRAAQVSINVGASGAGVHGGLPRDALGAQGYGPLGGDDGLRAFARAVTTTAKRRPLVPITPADLLLATPAGRVAARLAMHLRHSLD